MREIKFRAYDVKTKTMFPVHHMEWGRIKQNLNHFHGYTDAEKDLWEVNTCNDVKKQTGVIVEGETILVDRFQINQYTNFRDKDGTEIYEADIIRIYNDELDEEDSFVGVINYHMGGFFSGDEDLLGNVNFRARVIGNVYENPKLIK